MATQTSGDSHSWDGIRYFIALAEAGSLSAAARRIGVAHTTVSRRVAALEASMGVKLFERNDNGSIRPTEDGRVAIERARRVAEAVTAFGDSVDSPGGDLSGSVRINATEGLANFWLIPRMRHFTKKHTRLRVEWVLMNKYWSEVGREVDVAVRLNRPPEADVRGRRSREDRFFPVRVGPLSGRARHARIPGRP